MTKVQTWTMTGLGLLSLVIGVILAGMAVTSAQESSPTASATPVATEPAGDDGTADDGTPTDDSTDIGDCTGDGPHGLGGWRSVEDAAAEALGLTEDDLHAAFDEGQTLADIAEAQGMSADDLKAAIVESVTADLQAKLDAGDLTQDQFDNATANLSDRIDEIVNSTPPMGGPGGHRGGHGFGRGGPGPFFDDGTSTDDTAETTTDA